MAYAFVKITPQGVTGTTSPITALFTGGNTTGNLIIVFVDVEASATDQVTGITDTEGNVYTKSPASNSGSDGTGSTFHSIWTAPVTGGSGTNNTVSVAWTPGTRIRVSAVEYSGLTGLLDTSAHGGGGVATATYPITAAAANENLLTFASQQGGGVTFSALSGTARTALTNQNTVVFDQSSVSGSNTISATISASGAHLSTLALPAAATTFSITGNAGTAGATVSWSGAASGSTTADGSGNYTIPNLANGSYTITPSLAGFTFSPTSSNQTVSGANITGVNFTATVGNAYSVPDCRLSPFGPNASRSVQGTLIYDKQTSSNSAIPGVDSRVQGAPVDCRISPNIPQNSRAPGTYGPGE